jgi:hypothetical protein
VLNGVEDIRCSGKSWNTLCRNQRVLLPIPLSEFSG